MARRRSYQRGNVEMHNGVWTLRFRLYNYDTRKWEQKREVIEGDFKNKKAARRATEGRMSEVNDHNNRGKAQRRVEMTFAQFVQTRWKERARTHQPSTMVSYNSMLSNYILPAFGEKALADITPSDLSDFLESTLNLSASTRSMIYSLLNVIFDLAKQLDIITDSPVRSKLHRPALERKEKPILTPDQIRTVISLMPEEYRLFLALLALTGRRVGEILALRWCDFNAQKFELKINHTIFKGNLKQAKTKASRGVVKLAPAVAAMLVDTREVSGFQGETDFIFCRPDGSPLSYSGLRHRLKKAMARAGIKGRNADYCFHVFRHSAGSVVWSKTRDLKLVQDMLGHANSNTTANIYLHLKEEARAEGATIMADEILPSCDLIVTRKRKKIG